MCIKHLIPALVLLAMTAHAQADTVEYLHTDILGNVVAVTDENANVIERRVYEPYGLPETPIPDGPGFTGHDMDGETGLVYMQQRYYDPMVGRFLSTDPMAVDLTTAWNFNRYNYAANNPYRHTDPDGRNPLLIFVIVATLLSHSDHANAPTLGEEPTKLSVGDHIVPLLPAGRALTPMKAAAKYRNTSGTEPKTGKATGHTKNARPSTEQKHQKGQTRKQRDRGGEKADEDRRHPRKRPPDHKGPWPPKDRY